MLDTNEAFRHLQGTVKAPPNAADMVLTKLHQRRKRSAFVGAAASAALFAGTFVAVTQLAQSWDNDPVAVTSNDPPTSQSLSDAEIETWQRSVAAYTDKLVGTANGYENYAGSAYDNDRRTLTIYGVGQPTPEVSDVMNDHPDNITPTWVQVPFTAYELQAAAQAVLEHPAVVESSVGKDYSHIEVNLKPGSESSDEVERDLREVTEVPIRISTDLPLFE